MIKQHTHQNIAVKKQQGATLFTSLVFLALMTIIGVSATKISIMDLLVSGNNTQSMMMFQETANELKKFTNPISFFTAFSHNKHGEPWEYTFSSNSNDEKKITSRHKEYYCGGFNGLAVSIGPDVSPCFLYDFDVRRKKSHSSISDRHFRGAGKEFPNISRNSSLN